MPPDTHLKQASDVAVVVGALYESVDGLVHKRRNADIVARLELLEETLVRHRVGAICCSGEIQKREEEGGETISRLSLSSLPSANEHTHTLHTRSLSLSLSLSLSHELSKSAGADADVSLTENGRRWIEDSISLVLTSIHTRLWHRIQIMVRDD